MDHPIEFRNIKGRDHNGTSVMSVADFGRASIAHDVNNLLTPIILIMSSLQDEQVGTPKQRERIKGAVACAGRLQSLVRQLAVSAPLGQLAPSRVCPREMLSELETVFRCALGARIHLELKIASMLPIVWIDREKMERALLNLVVNARDAMPDGGTVTLCAYLECVQAPEMRHEASGIIISVSDNGIGMDANTLRRAGDAYFTTKPNGSGLGLPTARHLVERLGGALKVTSGLGCGTVIDIWLPACCFD